MFERPVSFKKEGRKNLVQALQQGVWVTTAFDVPPYLTRENVKVRFLAWRPDFQKGSYPLQKDWEFPSCLFSLFWRMGESGRFVLKSLFMLKMRRSGPPLCRIDRTKDPAKVGPLASVALRRAILSLIALRLSFSPSMVKIKIHSVAGIIN